MHKKKYVESDTGIERSTISKERRNMKSNISIETEKATEKLNVKVIAWQENEVRGSGLLLVTILSTLR